MGSARLVRLMFPDRDSKLVEIADLPVPGDGTLVRHGEKTWAVTAVVHDWDTKAETDITIYLKPPEAAALAGGPIAARLRDLKNELKALAGRLSADALVFGDRHGAGLEDAAERLQAEVDRLFPEERRG